MVGEKVDILVLEQFPDMIRVWVRWHQPGTVGVSMKFTEEYTEVDFPRKERRPV